MNTETEQTHTHKHTHTEIITVCIVSINWLCSLAASAHLTFRLFHIITSLYLSFSLSISPSLSFSLSLSNPLFWYQILLLFCPGCISVADFLQYTAYLML